MYRFWTMFLALAACAATTLRAEPQASPASSRHIDELIAQLDADQFGQREAAAAKLKTLGKPAIPALRKAALGESLEVTCRAVDVLAKLLQSTDESMRTAAKAALDELAKSEHGAAAARAAAAVKPKPDKNAPGGAVVPNIIFGGGGGNIVLGANVVVGGAGARRVSVTEKNGNKQIEAEEDGRKVKINQDAKGIIKMEVTEKKDGKEVTKKYEAPSANELKKKHPQAHDLYKKYQQNGQPLKATATITINAIGGLPGNMPNIQILPGPAVPGQAAPPPVAPRNSAAMAAGVLKGLAPHLAQLTDKAKLEASSPESRDELKKQVAQLKRQLSELERRLDAAPAKPAAPAPAAPLHPK